MANIVKINSGKGLVSFSKEELIDLDLTKWIRADSNGVGNRHFIAIQPIEKAAAKVYKDKFPSVQVKIAEKCFLRMDGSVDVVLRVAQDVSDGHYKKHPTKLTLAGDVHAKETTAKETFNEMKLDKSKKGSGLKLPIDFLEENIQKLSDDEKRQIFAELGTDDADIFLNDIKMAFIDSSSLDKLADKIAKDLEVDSSDDVE